MNRQRSQARASGGRMLAVLVAATVAGTLAPGAAQAVTSSRVPVSKLSFSAKGAAFVATFEGFVATPYDDPGDNCTIGFGHLIHRGVCTPADRDTWGTISRRRGLAMLRSDAGYAAAGLRTQLAGERLDQGEFDALVSFTYNIGLGGFAESSVKKDLLATPPRYGAVPKHMRLWVYSSGQYLCGLYRRRVNEGHLFTTGSYAISSPACPGAAAPGVGAARPAVAPGTPA